MKRYMAPMEGITGYIYRNAHHRVYGSMDKYFTPFIVPSSRHAMRGREKRDVLPENNAGVPVIPQILTNSGEAFVELSRELEQLGYREVNLNLGCPSGTVTAKGKGAGVLADPEHLEEMLSVIYRNCPLRVSVKTRLGIESPEEFVQLLEIYRHFPMEELIVHPRVLKDYYKNIPRREYYAMAAETMGCPVIYNGNLFREEEIRGFEEEFPKADGIMLGRGLIADPGLGTGDEADVAERFVRFHDLVYQGHRETQSGDKNLMFRMKELWYYMIDSFDDHEKMQKRLRRIERASEYEIWFREMMHSGTYDPKRGFRPTAGTEGTAVRRGEEE